MNSVETLDQLQALKQEKDAVLVLFGGANCGVCQSIKPQISDKFSQAFPELEMV